MSTMPARAWIGVVVVLAFAAGCGDGGKPDAAAPTSALTAMAPPGATPSPSTSSSGSAPHAATVEALSLAELRRRVLDAVRAQTSVHLAIGNLNPPPLVAIDQDYSRPDGDLELVVSIAPGAPAIVGRRVDGEAYLSTDGTHFERVPADKLAQTDGGALVAQLRTDVVKDLTALFAGAVEGDFDGRDASLGAGVARYRLKLSTTAWFDAQGDVQALGIPRSSGLPEVVPARLWIRPDGLPVRLELKYSEPLGGVAGTGTGRIDFSRWGEPVEVEKPATSSG